MKNDMKVEELLSTKLPEDFREIGIGWWKEGDFQLVLSRTRLTKHGDYRYLLADASHIITINEGLNQWSFLLTYTHEVAHYNVYCKYGPGKKHHGSEWKKEFKVLLLKLLASGNIPDILARPLAAYSLNPRASTSTYHPLLLVLSSFDEVQKNSLYDLSPGSEFSINGTMYIMLDRRRTRALCKQISSGRKYLVSMAAQID